MYESTNTKEKYVRILDTKDADGRDLFGSRWMDEYFPDRKNITGIIWGRSGSSIMSMKDIDVILAVIKDGKVIKRSSQRRSFRPDQIQEI